MVDIVNSNEPSVEAETKPRGAVPSWVITVGSLCALIGLWEIFGRDINPVFGSYPSAIAQAFWELARSGKLWTAMVESLRPFFLGYGLAIVVRGVCTKWHVTWSKFVQILAGNQPVHRGT